YSLVLDLRSNNVLALAAIEVRHTLDRQVVGLCRTTGPEDLARISIDQLGNLATTVFGSLLGLPAKQMRARGRIAKLTIQGQAFHHLGRHARINRCCSGIVEVDRQLHETLLKQAGAPSVNG